MANWNFGWDYPPGVTGNEPQITGEWPEEDEFEYDSPEPPEDWDETFDHDMYHDDDWGKDR